MKSECPYCRFPVMHLPEGNEEYRCPKCQATCHKAEASAYEWQPAMIG